MVLKVTSILSRHQREIAEKEAKLLSRLSHPSIIKMYDAAYRSVPVATNSGGVFKRNSNADETRERPQHLILMEYCEGGHALDVCNQLAEQGSQMDLSTLIIAFGQICNAVSYLHAQRPPIVHRDLKPANFLVQNGTYKLCDFGSAVFGHVDLKTQQARTDAEEVIQKTTTQMFRAPEMVDLFQAKKLTQATDVWALGCCLYSMAYLQNCFEEGSNLAILSRKYKIPDDNPYGEGLVDLMDRMLDMDSKARADMTEVILCLSAIYSGRPLPPRRKKESKKEEKSSTSGSSSSKEKKKASAGKFRTDGQGMADTEGETKKPVQAKKLDPNSAAARRRRAAGGGDFDSLHSQFGSDAGGNVNQDLAFSTTENHFASVASDSKSDGASDIFLSGESGDADVMDAFGTSQNWGNTSGSGFDAFATFQSDTGDAQMTEEKPSGRTSRAPLRSRSRSRRSGHRRTVAADSEDDDVSGDEETDDGDNMEVGTTDEEDQEDEEGGETKSRRQARRPSGRSGRLRRTTSGGTEVLRKALAAGSDQKPTAPTGRSRSRGPRKTSAEEDA